MKEGDRERERETLIYNGAVRERDKKAAWYAMQCTYVAFSPSIATKERVN